ncbi:inorganic phosphate transporter [Halocatena pleomorpha]|uniref:Phosphate transporter n=1 Tax=Halocatena pleomorpha TaxID=1785090 RepID=A0A3P3RKR8_9EURY|nr:inorganic phosphate transporter [Halocatena pleomorpha]RRJ33450.1 anion permease [Halocatena pleomorpha]
MVNVILLGIGLVMAVFVGINIGGSNTGAAFGPAVGSNVLSKLAAGGLMALFALLGGWILGPNVVETLGGDVVPARLFSIEASIAILFFIGFALLISNWFGVPASTSMTAVGAIAGLGLATGQLNWAVMGWIVVWWLVAPILAFWVSGVVGRYFYPKLVAKFEIAQTQGPLFHLNRSGAIPRIAFGPGTTQREVLGTAVVVVIGCAMAFSAGASNVANAVAPLVGYEAIGMEQGVVLGGLAIGLGGLTIGRRTLDTVGNDLTELPLLAAVVVEFVTAVLVSFLSWLGIPASFVVIATMSILGLGWGRATRTVTATDAVRKGTDGSVSVGALAAEGEDTGVPTVGRPNPVVAGVNDSENGNAENVPAIGEEDPADLPSAEDLFEPGTTARVIALQNLVPGIATVGAYLLFRFVPLA